MSFRASIFATVCAVLLPYAALAEGKSIIVLDASGSMWGQIDGRAKLEIAREALAGVLAGIDPATELGLMAYGHREKGSCSDIELVVPPGPGTAQAISDAAAGMKFLGKTPLSEAVRQAAAELRSTEAKATVILITDGIETCDADPCALGNELEASGVDFTTHVVGFGLTAEEGKTVACLAENTGGKYIEAKDASSLSDALKTTVAVAEPEPEPAPAPEPTPPPAAPDYNFAPLAFFAPGAPVPVEEGTAFALYQIASDGSLGDRVTTEYGEVTVTIEPGTYKLETKLDEVTVLQDVTITADAIAAPEVILNAGRVIIHPKGSAGGPDEDSAAVQLLNAAGERQGTYYGTTDIVVPAGDLNLRVEVGNAFATQTVAITAAQTTEVDIIAEAGLAAVEGFYVDGMMLETNAHSVAVYPVKKNLDGSRDRIATAYGAGSQFTLPPGDYVVEVGLDLALAEAPFTVKGGERVDVSVVLNAGVMAVTAPGASSILVMSGKANISGERERLHTEYGEAINLTAAAGDYVIEAYRGDPAVMTEARVTVVAGERTEITVP
ncbi:MAG: VWA domain-containing protein [Fuscovulum sp.]|nr:MAG: VWA domain-containing protein [Fuscovulum sp.]